MSRFYDNDRAIMLVIYATLIALAILIVFNIVTPPSPPASCR